MLELEFTLMSGNHVFEGFGSGSGDERGKWSFLVNNGESLVIRTRDLDTYGQITYSPTYMQAKTFPYDQNPIDTFEAFAQQLMDDTAHEGYCHVEADNFNQVSNVGFCGQDSATENIGYYYQVDFPVHYNNMQYCFDLPVEMNLGGIAFLNGEGITYDMSIN